jgi:hypothetical protein
MPTLSGPITSAVQYDSLVAFNGQTNIVVNGGNGDGRISINNSVITVTNPGTSYTEGITTIGGGSRIVLTVDPVPKIQLKRSSVTGKIPTTADLEDGELALNTADGILYYKNNQGNISSLSSGGGGGSTALTEQIATEKAIIMAIALG